MQAAWPVTHATAVWPPSTVAGCLTVPMLGVRRVPHIACGIQVLRDLEGRDVRLALVPRRAEPAHLNVRSGTLPQVTTPAGGAPMRRAAGDPKE